MIALSIIFYLSIKNTIFLLYSFSILIHRAVPQASLDGTLQKYLMSGFPFVNTRAYLLGACLGFFLSAKLFTKVFKGQLSLIQENIIKYYQILNLFVFIGVILSPQRYQIFLSTGMEWSFMILASLFAFSSYRKSFSVAKYFMVSYPVILVFTFFSFLKFTGIIPINDFTSHYFQIGTIIEMLLLGMALAEIYNKISIETIHQKSSIIEQEQKNELKNTILSSLSKQVKTAAQLSDKLNSPVLVLYNCHETLERKFKTSVNDFHASWEKVNKKMESAIGDLQLVSQALDAMKENDSKLLESTARLKKETIVHDTTDAPL